MRGIIMADKKNWIKGAIKKPGTLHKELGISEGKKIPKKTLDKAAKKGGKLGARAVLSCRKRNIYIIIN